MKKLTALIMCAIAFSSCKKNDEVQLPDVTHSGANKFACKIDGAVFTVDGLQSNVWTREGVLFQYSTSAPFYIEGNKADPKSHMTLEFEYKGDGRYNLAMPNNTAHWYDFSQIDYGPTTVFITDSLHTGIVDVKYDGSIISGTFNFDAINEQGKVAHITEGRFDIKR